MHHIMTENIISVSRLIDMLNESPATVRRDLAFLEENGYIMRTHGYARYIPPAVVNSSEISPGKFRVAKAAAALIPDNAIIFLDSGLSSKALAIEIAARNDISVYTNSLSVANVLSDSNVMTYLTCGFLEGRQAALVGSDTEQYVRQLRFPLLFLTTTGIRPKQGLACVTAAQANLKSALIQSAEKVIVLTEAYKFSVDSIRIFASFDQLDTIIVDAPLNNPEMEASLRSKKVELIIADNPSIV